MKAVKLPAVMQIVGGTLYQGSINFSGISRGRQCCFMALSALLYLQQRSPVHDQWTSETIDEITCYGDQMFLNALNYGSINNTSSLLVENMLVVANSLSGEMFCVTYRSLFKGYIGDSYLNRPSPSIFYALNEALEMHFHCLIKPYYYCKDIHWL